ncbi:hypothetical protein [Enterocloster lavalensis]|uniref:hypothetical protein n=1 Tax=Enterocloster lavalensis TaxID=460384 RepID=UPI0023F0C720|nr:hypothetical protein [Enterocloster lavalensis]
MELTSGDLLAIYRLMDVKLSSALQPIKNDIRDIKLDIENDIKPQIQRLTERVNLETADKTVETQPFPY